MLTLFSSFPRWRNFFVLVLVQANFISFKTLAMDSVDQENDLSLSRRIISPQNSVSPTDEKKLFEKAVRSILSTFWGQSGYDVGGLIHKHLEPSDFKVLCSLSMTTATIAAQFNYTDFLLNLEKNALQFQGAEKDFQALSETTIEELYRSSLRAEFPNHPHRYGLLRFALEKNSSFKAIEERAKERAQKDFCLNEDEQEGGSWLKTCIYHFMFWEGFKDDKVLNWLSQKGFYLASLTSLLHMGEDSAEMTPLEAGKNTMAILADLVKVRLEVKSLLLFMPRNNKFVPAFPFLELSKLEGLKIHPDYSMDHVLIDAVNVKCIEYLELHKENPQKSEFVKWLKFFYIGYYREPHGLKLYRDPHNMEEIMCCPDNLYSIAVLGSDIYYTFYKNKFFNKLSECSSLFILLWQKNTRYLAGLTPDEDKDFYMQAQKAYKDKFEMAHPGSFQFTFEFPRVARDTHFWDSTNRFLCEAERESEAEEESQQNPKKVEARWAPLVMELGDPLIAYELAAMWANYQGGTEKAQQWFSQYQTLAPSLPFGNFLSLPSEPEPLYIETKEST